MSLIHRQSPAKEVNMTVFPFQVNEVMHLYSRLSKLKPSAILEKDQSESQDVVNISAEVKKRQIPDTTVIEGIKPVNYADIRLEKRIFRLNSRNLI